MRIPRIFRPRIEGSDDLFSKALDMAQWKLFSSSPIDSIRNSNSLGAKAGGGPTIRKISNGSKSVDVGGNLGYRLDNLKQMIPTLSLSLHSDAAEVNGDTLRIRDQALFDTIQTAVKPWNDYLESDAGTAKLKSASADGEISPQEVADIAEEVAKGSAEDIVKELREGKGLGQIAKERGSNRGDLIHQLEMAGLDVTVLWDMENSDVAEDIAEGKSLEEAAEERGLSREELIEELDRPREDNWKGKKEWLEIYDADGELLVGYYDGSNKKGGNELKTRFADDDSNEVERVEQADGEVSKTTSDGEEGKTRTVTKPDGTVEKTVIDENGRETMTITDTQAEGEPATKKITNNGYTLTTGADGKKTLTDESDGMVFPIEKGSVLEGLARTLLDLNPDKSRKDTVQLAAIERDLANMQLAAAEKAAKESPKERKDHDRQPAIPEAGTGNDGLDPYGKPPADGNLWVPLNGVWMTPEAARATLQEEVAASWLAEAQAKAAQKQAALDVYALDPNYRQAVDSATSRMNELHAPEMRPGYEWLRPSTEGSLADAGSRLTNANRALEDASRAREGKESNAKRLQGMLAKPTQENIASYYTHAREAYGDSPSVQSIAFGDKRINVGGSKGNSWENLRLLFPELNDNPNVSMRGGNLTIDDSKLFKKVSELVGQWDNLAIANQQIQEFFKNKKVKGLVKEVETLFREHYPRYYFDEQGFKYKTSSTESESGKLKDSRVTLDQASGQLVLRNVYEGEGKGSEDDLVFYFQLTHAPGDPRRGVPRVTTGDADTARGEAGVTIVNPEPRSHRTVTETTRERNRRLGELDERWTDLSKGDNGLDSLIERLETAQESVDKQFEGMRRQQTKDARERTSAAQDGVDAVKEEEGEGTLVPDGNGEPQQLALDDAHQKDEGLEDLDGRWVHPKVNAAYLALVAANSRLKQGNDIKDRVEAALLSQPEFQRYAKPEGYSYEHGQPAISGKTPTKTTGERVSSDVEERDGHLYLVNTYAKNTQNGTNAIEQRLTYDPGEAPEGVERTKEQRQLDKEWATWKEGARDSDTKSHLQDAETARNRARNKLDRSLDTFGRGSREKVTREPSDGKNLVLVSVDGDQFWATPGHAEAMLKLNEARAQENALKVGDRERELENKRGDFLAGGKQVWALDDGNLTPLLDPQMLRQWALYDDHRKMIGTEEGNGGLTRARERLLDSQEDLNITQRNLEERKIAGAEKQEPGLGDLDPKRFVNSPKNGSAEPSEEWTPRERQLLDTEAGRIWLGAQLNLASLKQEESQVEAFREQWREDVRWSDFLLTQGQEERRPDNLPALKARYYGKEGVADDAIAKRLEAIEAQLEASSRNGLRVDGEGVAEALRLALDQKDGEGIGAVEDQLRNVGGKGAEIEIMPILYRDESTGVRDTALFQVRDKDDGRLWLVDENGSKYRGLDDFQRNSLLSPEGQVYLPTGLGRLTDLDGKPAYEWGQARKLSFAEQHLDLPVSLVTGTASLASFTPLAPVAAPIAYAGGTYLGMRSIDKLRTMHAHGRSLASWEGVMEGAMVATSVLPMVSSGARYIGLTGAGVNGGTAARISIGAVSPQSQNPLYQTTSNLMRQRGGAFTTARYADAGALTLGVPLVSYSAYDIAQHGGEMSGLELTNALMGVASGTFGTAYGAIGLKNTWPRDSRAADSMAGETGPFSVSAAYHPVDPRIAGQSEWLRSGMAPATRTRDIPNTLPTAYRDLADIDEKNLLLWLADLDVNPEIAQSFVAQLHASDDVSIQAHNRRMENLALDQVIAPEGYKIVYRGDSRNFEEIHRAGGFKIEGQPHPRGEINTSLSSMAARYYARYCIRVDGGEGWVYAIAKRDIDDSPLHSGKSKNIMDPRLEAADPNLTIAVREDIPAANVIAAQQVDRNGDWVGSVVLAPSAYNVKATAPAPQSVSESQVNSAGRQRENAHQDNVVRDSATINDGGVLGHLHKAWRRIRNGEDRGSIGPFGSDATPGGPAVNKSSPDYRPEALRARLPKAIEEAYSPTPDHDEPTVIFRGDTRTPEDIFSNGFNEEGQSFPSGVISTSLSAREAKGFAKGADEEGNLDGTGGWLYTIIGDVTDGDIVYSLPVEGSFPSDRDHYEVQFPNEVPPEDILAARRVGFDGQLYGPVVYNRNFKNPARLPDESQAAWQVHPVIQLNDEMGGLFEAKVLGYPPESAEKIYVRPEMGPRPRGDEDGVRHKTHILLHDSDNKAFVMPWIRGASEDHILSQASHADSRAQQARRIKILDAFLNDNLSPNTSRNHARITAEVIDAEHIYAFNKQMTPHDLLLSTDLHKNRQWRDHQGPIVLDIQNPSVAAIAFAQKLSNIYGSEVVAPRADDLSQWYLLRPEHNPGARQQGSVELMDGELILTQGGERRVIQPDSEHLGEMVGAGLHKTAIRLYDKVLVIYRDGRGLYSAAVERGAAEEYIKLGAPYVAPIHGTIKVNGRDALVMDYYPAHISTTEALQPSLLNENSVSSLKAIRRFIEDKNLIPSDLQFLVDRDGFFYLHDFQEVRSPMNSFEVHPLNRFIELAEANVRTSQNPSTQFSAGEHGAARSVSPLDRVQSSKNNEWSNVAAESLPRESNEAREARRIEALKALLADVRRPDGSDYVVNIPIEEAEAGRFRFYGESLSPHELLLSNKVYQESIGMGYPIVIDIQQPSPAATILALRLADITSAEVVLPRVDEPIQWQLLRPNHETNAMPRGTVELSENGELILVQDGERKMIRPEEGHLGPLMGAGGAKSAFRLYDKVVVIHRGDKQGELHAQVDNTQELVNRGAPYVAPIHGITQVHGHQALVMDFYTTHNRKVTHKYDSNIEQSFASENNVIAPHDVSLLNQNSLASLREMRDFYMQEGIGVGDPQFLIDGDGYFYLHDFEDIYSVWENPGLIAKIDEHIALAEAAIQQRQVSESRARLVSDPPHQTIRLVDEAGVSLEAKVPTKSFFGPPPENVEAIYVPPEIGPRLGGEQLREAGKTHQITDDREWVMPIVGGRAEKGEPATPNPNHLSGSAASPAQQRVLGSGGPDELLNLETLVYQHAMFRDPAQPSLPRYRYEPTQVEADVLNVLRDISASQGHAVRFAVGEEAMPLEAFHQQGGGLDLAHTRLFSSFDAAVAFAAQQPSGGMRQTSGGWVYKVVAPEPLVNAWAQPRPGSRIPTAQIEGGLRVYSDGGLFPGPVVNSQYAAPAATAKGEAANEQPNQSGSVTPPQTAPISLARPLSPRALSVSPDAVGQPRLYRLDDLDALRQAVSSGDIPVGNYLHVIRSQRAADTVTLNDGRVPYSGRIQENGWILWPAGRTGQVDDISVTAPNAKGQTVVQVQSEGADGQRTQYIRSNGDVHIVVTELSAKQVRERFRSGSGLSLAEHGGMGAGNVPGTLPVTQQVSVFTPKPFKSLDSTLPQSQKNVLGNSETGNVTPLPPKRDGSQNVIRAVLVGVGGIGASFSLAAPPHISLPLNALAMAVRGASLGVRSLAPDKTAVDTVRGRIHRGVEFVTLAINNPNSATQLTEMGGVVDTSSSALFVGGNTIYLFKTFQESVKGQPFMPWADDFALPMFGVGSGLYTASSGVDLWKNGGILAAGHTAAGTLFAAGSTLLWFRDSHMGKKVRPFKSSEPVQPNESSPKKRDIITATTFGPGLLAASMLAASSLFADEKEKPSDDTTPTPPNRNEPRPSEPDDSNRIEPTPPENEEPQPDVTDDIEDDETDERGRFNPDLKGSADYEEIIVQPGQTIGGIAVRHRQDIAEVVELNMDHISDPGDIYPGDRIYLPK